MAHCDSYVIDRLIRWEGLILFSSSFPVDFTNFLGSALFSYFGFALLSRILELQSGVHCFCPSFGCNHLFVESRSGCLVSWHCGYSLLGGGARTQPIRSYMLSFRISAHPTITLQPDKAKPKVAVFCFIITEGM